MSFENEEGTDIQRLYMTDADGEEFCLLLQDTIEVNGIEYAIVSEEGFEDEIMIYECERDAEGELALNPVDDDDIIQSVFDYYRAADEDYEFCDAE